MSVLCDSIQRFIESLLDDAEGEVVLKRNELAEDFGCTPSQITYVLQTRFSPLRGYATKSRRGGGGCIRIVKLDVGKTERIADAVRNELSAPLTMRRAESLVRGLAHSGVIDKAQGDLMLAAVSPEALKSAGKGEAELRTSILSQMLQQCVES